MTKNNVNPALPPVVKGTVLCEYCSGSTLVRTLADGNSGTYQETIPNNNLCRAVIKSTQSTFITKNSTNLTIDVSMLNGYIAGHTDVTITVNNSTRVYSTSIGIPALSIIGTSPGDNITLFNNGSILGISGNGFGGAGLYTTAHTTLVNNGYICGGPDSKNVIYYEVAQKDNLTPVGPAILLGKNGSITYATRGVIWGDAP